MKANISIKDIDITTLLGAIYQRLNLLEQHIDLLRLVTLKESTSASSKQTFRSLRGIWAGIEISEEDIEEAQISLPDDL